MMKQLDLYEPRGEGAVKCKYTLRRSYMVGARVRNREKDIRECNEVKKNCKYTFECVRRKWTIKIVYIAIALFENVQRMN